MYTSQYYNCSQIDERLLQGYYDDAVSKGFEGSKEDFLEALVDSLKFSGDPSANKIPISNIPTLEAQDTQAALAELAAQVFPLEVSVGSYTSTYETGSEVTPSIPMNIKRRGEYVDDHADIVISPSGTYDKVNHRVTDSQFVIAEKTYTIAVTETGQSKTVQASYHVKPYLYKGVMDSKPSDVANFIQGSWRNSNKVLSNDTSIGDTQLAANKYYLFAVKQSAQGNPVTLIVKNAKSGGILDVPASDKGSDLLITRVNGSGSDYYSWIIVPASTSTWYFMITNS